MNTKLQFVILMVVGLASCNNDENKEDMVQSVNKKGSIETSVSVQPLDSLHDVLLTSHTIWNSDTAYKTVIYQDTIPALGLEDKKVEDRNGDIKKVAGKKEYEIFITVK